MTSLAGGLPHPSLFPFKHADIEVFDAHAPVDPQETSPNVENTHHIHLSQFGSQTENTLSKAMQYSQ